MVAYNLQGNECEECKINTGELRGGDSVVVLVGPLLQCLLWSTYNIYFVVLKNLG